MDFWPDAILRMAASKTWPRGGQPLSSRPRCWPSAYRSVRRVREEVTLKATFSIMQGVWGMQRSRTGFALSENVYEASPPQWGYRWGFIDISSPNFLGSEPLSVSQVQPQAFRLSPSSGVSCGGLASRAFLPWDSCHLLELTDNSLPYASSRRISGNTHIRSLS